MFPCIRKTEMFYETARTHFFTRLVDCDLLSRIDLKTSHYVPTVNHKWAKQIPHEYWYTYCSWKAAVRRKFKSCYCQFNK